MKTRTKKPYKQSYFKKYCRICGKELTAGNTCKSCEAFIKQMQEKERRAAE